MTEISESEKKRLIAAIKRRKPSDSLALKGLIQCPQQPASHRQFAQRFTQLMEKAGVDVHKLNESIRRKRREQLRLVEKRPQIDKKTLAADTRAFRHGIEERRRNAKQLATLDSQPARVFLDTPFFIDPAFMLSSNIEPWNSSGKFYLSYGDVVDTENLMSFYFSWRNDTFNDVLITAESYLIAKGSLSCNAAAQFGSAWVTAACWAQLSILEQWNKPPTTPLFEDTQSNFMGLDHADTIALIYPNDDVHPRNEIFRAFDVYHKSFFGVPAQQIVVFEVGILVSSFLDTHFDAGGTIAVDFASFDGFLACPFVELQVLPVQGVSVRSASSRRTKTGHLGRDAEAREAAARVLELDPAFTISARIARGGQSNAKLLIEGLRKAGLPE